MWQQYRWCLDVAEEQILGGTYVFSIGTRIRKDLVWWLKKGTLPSRAVPLPMDSPLYRCESLITISWTITISLNREVALKEKKRQEEKKAPERVSEYLHIHLRMPSSSHHLRYLPPELSRYSHWQLRAQMKIQQPWIHKTSVSDSSRVTTENKKVSRRQGPEIQKGK